MVGVVMAFVSLIPTHKPPSINHSPTSRTWSPTPRQSPSCMHSGGRRPRRRRRRWWAPSAWPTTTLQTWGQTGAPPSPAHESHSRLILLFVVHRAQTTLAALDAEGMVHCGMRRSGESRAWCMFERTAGALHAVSQGGSSKKRTPQRSGGIARAVSPGRRKAAAAAPAGAADTLRVGVYAATWGVNFPDRAEECAAAGVRCASLHGCAEPWMPSYTPMSRQVTIQTVPGLTAASPSGEGVDVRCARCGSAPTHCHVCSFDHHTSTARRVPPCVTWLPPAVACASCPSTGATSLKVRAATL
jgi:hypothetical protein